MLKKYYIYLYGVRFTVKTDINTLVVEPNYATTDLPRALIIK